MKSGHAPTVLHMPGWFNNPYQVLLARGIEQADWNVIFRNYPPGVWSFSDALQGVPQAKALHLHWLHPHFKQFLRVENAAKFRIKALALQVDLWRVWGSGRRLVWTVHNEVSHETPNYAREVSLNRMVARQANHLIFHSRQAVDQFEASHQLSIRAKAAVIPHGNYVGWYKNDPIRAARLRKEFALDDGCKVYLVFGAIRQYKGIPNIIQAFRRTRDPSLRLLIVGQPNSESLALAIRDDASGDERIKLRFGFVADEDVAPMFSICHALVLGFERVLTSGSAVLGMSEGRALILPETANVLETSREGSWTYRDMDELAKLFESLDVVELDVAGQRNQCLAAKLSWSEIGRATAGLYE